MIWNNRNEMAKVQRKMLNFYHFVFCHIEFLPFNEMAKVQLEMAKVQNEMAKVPDAKSSYYLFWNPAELWKGEER